MRKIALILTATASLIACNASKKTTAETTTVTETVTTTTTQKAVTTTANTSIKVTPEVVQPKKTMLLGKEVRASLETAPFDAWFQKNYAKYTVNDSLTPALKKGLKGVTITTFMGTWCGDSKRETPRMFKILDAVKFKEKKTTLITVDRSKKNPKEFTDGQNILRVPTFIFSKDGQEIGRIVERPRQSLEEDMLKIVTGQPYKHSYEN